MRHLQKECKPKSGFKSTTKSSLVKTMQLSSAKTAKCAICLGTIQDSAFLSPCKHRFCFKCMQKWSRKKVICPVCKQQFHSFFHTVGTKGALSEYVLPLNDGSFSHSKSSEEHISTSSQRATSPPDNGIIYNEISGTLTRREKDIYQLMRQFAVTKKPSNIDLISLGKFKAQAAIQFRRTLYHTGILVQNTPNPDFNQMPSAEFFSRNPGFLDRLNPWLKRELQVLYGKQEPITHTLQKFILSNMTHHDLDSKEFEAVLRPYLHHFTGHFLHEFISFVQSSLNLKKYDWHALYECPALMKEESGSVTSSASSDEEHPQLPESDQVPKPSGSSDDGNLGRSLSGSEKDLPDTSATAEDNIHSKSEEHFLEDLSNSDTEKGVVDPTHNVIKNKLLALPSDKKIQFPESLSHSKLFQCQKEKEVLGDVYHIPFLRSKNSQTCKRDALASGDYNAFNFYHRNAAKFMKMKNLNKKPTTKCQLSDFLASQLKDYSLGRQKRASSRTTNVCKNGRSKNSIECKFEEVYSASRERYGGTGRVRFLHDEKKWTYNARDRRHRQDKRKSKPKGASTFHKSPLPLKNQNSVARVTNNSKSQSTLHLKKTRNKDCDYLRKRPSSEPNWNYLYYMQDCERFRYEEPSCRKDESARIYGPNPSRGCREKAYSSPENKISVNKRCLTKRW